MGGGATGRGGIIDHIDGFTFTGHCLLLGLQRTTGQWAEHHLTAGQVPGELNWHHREIIKNNLTFTFTGHCLTYVVFQKILKI